MEGEPLLLSPWIIPITILIGIWLTGVWTAFSELSRAQIRKLDPQNRKQLIKRAENWLHARPYYRILLRLLTFVNLAALAIVVQNVSYFRLPPVNDVGALSVLISAVITGTVFLLITELLGRGWLASMQWGLLTVSVPPLQLFYYLLSPIVYPSHLIERRLFQWGDDEDAGEKATTEDEIMSLVEQDAAEEAETGTLEASERRMIRGIFDLGETLVKEIMTPRVDIEALQTRTTFQDAKRKIVECGHTRIPVFRNSIDDIIGVVYSKHLLDDEKLREANSLEHIMQEPVFIPETKNVDDLLDEFRQTKIHLAVIIDEYGGTAGIVTIEDILEEIVGEIQDEFDVGEEVAEVAEADDGSFEVDARTPVDEINERLHLSISEEEEYDTVGGYVISVLGRIPKTKEVVQMPDMLGMEVQILEADNRKVRRLRIVNVTGGKKPTEAKKHVT